MTPALVVVVACSAVAADAPGDSRPAQPVAIRWVDGRVEVHGLARANLDALAQARWDPAHWSALFAVSVAPAGPTAPAIVGTYRVVDGALRFEPRFPWEPGLSYVARFRASDLPVPEGRDLSAEFRAPAPERGEPAVVVKVDPAAERLPENLLKFYVHFSRPMSRGKAYDRVRLLDTRGKPLTLPFLELGEELWDPSGTRLTLLLDPGRIKRGLRPREEEGPILETGKSYTFVVDADWPDATGNPLREGFRKRFTAGPADETQPDPKTWKIAAPGAGTTDPLRLTFPDPLDRAMLDRAIVVVGSDGRPVAGRLDVSPDATRWAFRPERPWAEGTLQLVIDAELEDLAGNSVARPFEVDALGPITRRAESKTVTLPVTIAKRS